MWAVSSVYAPPMLVCFQRDPVPLFSCEVHLAISWKLVAGQAFVVGGVHDERLRGTICEKTRPVFKNNLVVLIETGPQTVWSRRTFLQKGLWKGFINKTELLAWVFWRRGMAAKRKTTKRQNNLFWYFPNPPNSIKRSSKSSFSLGIVFNVGFSSISISWDPSIVKNKLLPKRVRDGLKTDASVCVQYNVDQLTVQARTSCRLSTTTPILISADMLWKNCCFDISIAGIGWKISMSFFYIHTINQEIQTISTSVVKQLKHILIQLSPFLHSRWSSELDYDNVHNSFIFIGPESDHCICLSLTP